MAANKDDEWVRQARIIKGKVINKQKLAELERIKEDAKPKQKPTPKTGGLV